MNEPSEFSKEVARLTDAVHNLAATQATPVDAMREVQGVMLFGMHDDLVQLDGELDNMYPEAFE
ncbi:hypothetical protein HUT16_01370 [Kitasatospora sp. NA04385]|uniref:hypothetical protein n=1 Tax=Kitasatospora sp. NA04385 TaxID=2742135 RepID=UPI001591A5E2|nr:hypothetical protein [Kitasatospora sp. NA04385]QKW17890.1 hypothetical protein HUT16_01370 [Kitasatospora sp. NA04385]